ncbi:hypothetical protein H072_2223 [Dactylellina haptotyla CBS 200.50]|uniref:Uncharacterized protein n=1 Tax=Dactylellina haptotyla (strain CBS 200.50) TaxID=1284197 RepID=S8ALL0_DACHA|nr:hypothetical protein H072_2223 [Dactylellina haptotyla CBS 200.50]
MRQMMPFGIDFIRKIHLWFGKYNKAFITGDTIGANILFRKICLKTWGAHKFKVVTSVEMRPNTSSHKDCMIELLSPFTKNEELAVIEHRGLVLSGFFEVIKHQLETNHRLKDLTLEPNILNLCSEYDVNPEDMTLRGATSNLKTLRLTFQANEYDYLNSQRAGRFVEIISQFGKATRNLHTLTLDGTLPWYPRPSKRLKFPNLDTLIIHKLNYSEPPVPNVVYDLMAPETLSSVRVHSTIRPDTWQTTNEILDQFLLFPNLEELHLYHQHDYMDCWACEGIHKLLHILITPAAQDVKLLTQNLHKLKVVKWYSSYCHVLLFQYHVNRVPGEAVSWKLERSTFKKIENENGLPCADYHGRYPNVEVLDENIKDELKQKLDFTLLPPRIVWHDLKSHEGNI